MANTSPQAVPIFRFSEEVRKVGYWIYLYGSLGLVIKFYGIKADTLPIISIPVNGKLEFDPSGLFGIAVLYCLANLIIRAIFEYSSHFSSKLHQLQDQVLAAKSVRDLVPMADADPELQHILNVIRGRIERSGVYIRFGSVSLFTMDVVLPFCFGALCVYQLFWPAVGVIGVLTHRF